MNSNNTTNENLQTLEQESHQSPSTPKIHFPSEEEQLNMDQMDIEEILAILAEESVENSDI